MKRLVASLVFVAVVLAPIASFAQSRPKPTTRVIPCDARCKSQQCIDKGWEHARVVCGGASSENKNQCIVRNQRKYAAQCMRAPLGED
jgi:Ni/Co efflux regulator RcnB